MELKQPDQMNFEGNIAEAWKSFYSAYTFYTQATGVDKKAEKVQCAVLLHVIGKDAQDVYKSFQFEDSEKDKIAPLVAKFEEVFLPKKNLTIERFQFNVAVQKPGQTCEAYFTELRNLAQTCEFGDLKESLIKDRIVIGINDKRLQERLLQCDDLTLKKAVEMCKARETALLQAAELKPTDMDKCIEKLKTGWKPSGSQEQSKFRSQNTENGRLNTGERLNSGRPPVRQQGQQCSYCGSTHRRGQCPAYGQSCNKCGRLNHFAAVCRSRNVNVVDEHDEQSSSLSDNFQSMFIGAVSSSCKDDQSGWKESIVINNHPVIFKLDSGAQANTMSLKTFQSIKGNMNMIMKSNNNLIGYGEQKIMPIGEIILPCFIRNKPGVKAAGGIAVSAASAGGKTGLLWAVNQFLIIF